MSQKSVSASFFAFHALLGNCPALLAPVQGEGKRQTASEIFDVSLRQVRHFSRAGKHGCLAVRFAHSLPGSGHQLRHLFAAFAVRSVRVTRLQVLNTSTGPLAI